MQNCLQVICSYNSVVNHSSSGGHMMRTLWRSSWPLGLKLFSGSDLKLSSFWLSGSEYICVQLCIALQFISKLILVKFESTSGSLFSRYKVCETSTKTKRSYCFSLVSRAFSSRSFCSAWISWIFYPADQHLKVLWKLTIYLCPSRKFQICRSYFIIIKSRYFVYRIHKP